MRELGQSVSRGKTSGIVGQLALRWLRPSIVAAIDDSDDL
jgi:hypothetical protein